MLFERKTHAKRLYSLFYIFQQNFRWSIRSAKNVVAAVRAARRYHDKLQIIAFFRESGLYIARRHDELRLPLQRAIARQYTRKAWPGHAGKRKKQSMSVLPFDQRDGFIWMNGALVAWARRQASCTLARPALCLLRVRGRARLWRAHLQIDANIPSGSSAPPSARLRDSLFGRRTRRDQASVVTKNNFRIATSAPSPGAAAK